MTSSGSPRPRAGAFTMRLALGCLRGAAHEPLHDEGLEQLERHLLGRPHWCRRTPADHDHRTPSITRCGRFRPNRPCLPSALGQRLPRTVAGRDGGRGGRSNSASTLLRIRFRCDDDSGDAGRAVVQRLFRLSRRRTGVQVRGREAPTSSCTSAQVRRGSPAPLPSTMPWASCGPRDVGDHLRPDALSGACPCPWRSARGASPPPPRASGPGAGA